MLTIIRGGIVIDSETGDSQARDVVVDGSMILAVLHPGEAGSGDARILDASDRLLVPGLVNAHTHGHGFLARGAVADRATLEMFLCASGGLNGARTPEDIYLSTALGAVEMIRKGCTACYDLCVELPAPSVTGIHAVGQAYDDIGLRAVVAPMVSDIPIYRALPGLLDSLPPALRETAAAVTAPPGEASLAAVRQAFRDWPFDRARIRPAIGPAIPLHCSDPFLQACGCCARDFDMGLHTHLAETQAQAAAGRLRYGRSLTMHLSELGLLGPGFCGAHGVWLDADDRLCLADSGAAVAHNPCSNLRLGSGIADLRAMLAAGIAVGIGSDASNTSDGQNMFEATRLAAYLSRVKQGGSAQWVSAVEALRLATLGSASVLGFGDIGRIAPSYRADIVFLSRSSQSYVPLRDPATQMVFAETGAAVTDVMIEGRMVLEDGRMTTIDEGLLRRRAESAALRLEAATEPVRRFAAEVADPVERYGRSLQA